jgi:hypothetical protein
MTECNDYPVLMVLERYLWRSSCCKWQSGTLRKSTWGPNWILLYIYVLNTLTFLMKIWYVVIPLYRYYYV